MMHGILLRLFRRVIEFTSSSSYLRWKKAKAKEHTKGMRLTGGGGITGEK